MVRGKFKLRIRKKIRMSGVKVPKRLDVCKLNEPNMRKTVSDKLDSFVFDGTWDHFKEFLGLQQRQHRDWFGENDTYS